MLACRRSHRLHAPTLVSCEYLGRAMFTPDHTVVAGAPGHDSDASGFGTESVTQVAGSPSEPEQAPQFRRGSTIGRYVVVDVLGQGGMGVVHAAYDPELDRKIAIKVLRQTEADRGSSGRARLVREAQALARLSHPNVVNVHDVGEAEGQVFVAMEFIEGVTVRQWRQQRERSQREILDVLVAAGRGLEAAHAAGLVHRDFKPDNVLVGTDGRTRVVDFGLAIGRATQMPDTSDTGGGLSSAAALDNVLTAVGTVVGTPAYMAPEQHIGAATDAATDQFAFCVTLFEALYGIRPFSGEDVQQLARAACGGKTNSPPAGNTVPAWLRRLVLRGLSPRPDDRHVSMSALLAELSRDPRRARRRLVVATVAALGVVAVGVSAYFTGAYAPDDDPCLAAGSAMDAVWNPQRRAQMLGAFEGSEVSYAADTHTRIDAAFEAYATAWKDGATSACHATHVAQTQSGERLARRLACLDARREGMDAMLDLVEGADPRILEHAVSAVGGLPSIGACEDLAALAQGVQPPANETMRAQVDALTIDQERAAATHNAGLYRQALAQRKALADRAEQIGYLPARTRAAFDLAATQANLAMPEVDASSRAAYVLALESGHDLLAGRTASNIAHRFVVDKRNFAQARHWISVASALGRRKGGDAFLAAAELNVLAMIAREEGRDDDARVGFEALLAHARANEQPVVVPLTNLAAFHAGRNEIAQARVYMEEASALVADKVGPSHPDMLSLKSNLAVLQLLDRDYAAARRNLREVLSLQRAALGERHPDLARTMVRLAATERQLGDAAEAERLNRAALEQQIEFLGADHLLVAKTLGNLAIARSAQGFDEDALQLAREALATTTRLKEPSPSAVAGARASVGTFLVDLQRYAEAAPLLKEALEVLAADPAEAPLRQQAFSDLGRAQRGLGKEEAALESFEASLALAQRQPHASELAWALMHVATSLRALGRDTPRVAHIAERVRALVRESTLEEPRLNAALRALDGAP